MKFKPAGWRVLIKPLDPEDRITTKSGFTLLKPDETKDNDKLKMVVAEVVAVGPLAYKDEDKYGRAEFDFDGTVLATPEPWCKPGDYVLIARFAGSRFKVEGEEYRLINDDEVLGTTEDPRVVQPI